MIRHLSIKDFAIIENTSIDFHDGLNMITGETGAGKSIVIEAVSLALGSRADTAFIRSGKEKAVIQMIAECGDEEYIITREISSAGKNICKVNGEIVTLSNLNGICKKLADIHGQYDHQSLLNPDHHIELVDLYKSDITQPCKTHVAQLYDEYICIKEKLKEVIAKASKNKREQDFMAFELDELISANLQVGEDSELEEEISILQNSEKIYESLAESYQIGSDSEPSVLSAIKRISNMISGISTYSSDLDNLSSRITEIYYEFEDICTTVRDLRDSSVFSPSLLDEKIARLEVINKLKLKHAMTIEELIEYRDTLAVRLEQIDNLDTIKDSLERDLSQCKAQLITACDKLTDARKQASSQLEVLITDELAQLNFSNASFLIDFKKTDSFTATGNDIVEFLISTNKGEALKPLSKIASGGEMSRIMLAFKRIIGDYDEIPTMIFDEIDSGISGIAASVVGKKLKEISENHQIICITHLPQIAAYGMHNYKISKHSDEDMTYTTVTALNQSEKTMEIARLLGGTNITETTIASAKELIAASK